MKKLGLVGGIGPGSTVVYYHDIVYGVQERVGKESFPSLTIESVDVFHILRLCGERDYDGLTDYLLQAIDALARSGAQFAALTANTPHIVFDRLQGSSPIPLISMIGSVRKEAMRSGLKKIGLLGTIFTMTQDFFKRPFLDTGIDIVVPSGEEMDYIHQKISSELEHDIVKEETLARFQTIVSRMRTEDGIEAVVLGCTELPLLLNGETCPVPCLDAMQIHIQDLIDEILAPADPGRPL